MAKKAFTKIKSGIEDAIAYAKSDTKRGVAHVVRVPEDVDVRAIRRRFGLSRAKFAARFGLDARALQDWEQRRRKPDRATRILFRVIDLNPSAVEYALGARLENVPHVRSSRYRGRVGVEGVKPPKRASARGVSGNRPRETLSAPISFREPIESRNRLDAMNRKLRVLSETEKAMVQRVILPVIATGTDGTFRPIGSCWIFALAGRRALAFSAAHIFEEVVRSEGRHRRKAASVPDVLQPMKPSPVNLALTKLKAIYRHRIDEMLFLDIHSVHRDGLLDVAVCELSFQSDAPIDHRFVRKMAIHAGPVPQGTEVAVVGYSGMERTRSHVDYENGLAWAEHFHQLTFEHGKCVQYYPARGPKGPIGPCFEINARSQHGMSGGPILHKGYGDEIVACGVVSRSTGFGDEEGTMAAALWPAYSFDINNLRSEVDQPLTLIELAQLGWIDDKSNGPAHFKRVKPLGENGGSIDWNSE